MREVFTSNLNGQPNGPLTVPRVYAIQRDRAYSTHGAMTVADMEDLMGYS